MVGGQIPNFPIHGLFVYSLLNEHKPQHLMLFQVFSLAICGWESFLKSILFFETSFAAIKLGFSFYHCSSKWKCTGFTWMIRQSGRGYIFLFPLWMLEQRQWGTRKSLTIDMRTWASVYGRETNGANTMRVDSLCMCIRTLNNSLDIYSRTTTWLNRKFKKKNLKAGWANC
jgi:hypothetical protein